MLLLGGSRGIGESIALAAGSAGFRVLLTYVNSRDAAQQVVERISSAGSQAYAMQADIAIEADLLRVFAEVDRLGAADLKAVVVNGGITGASSRLADASAATLARVLNVNLLGAMIGAREAVRRMSTLSGGTGGSIVFLSSRAAQHGAPGEYVWYAASKGGLDSLVTGLSREVAAEGIRVNAVSPGIIRTGIHAPGRLEKLQSAIPMQRPGEVDEVAAAVMFLLSDAASYVSGANLSVSGAR
jgi:NAD(P)-dependent dehydrogenase (short-subunit alcohol dehydrogenase family)